MRKIDGPFNVANRFLDQDPTNNPNGTVITGKFMNDIMDEFIEIQTQMGDATEQAGSTAQVFRNLLRMTKEFGRNVGDIFFNFDYKPISAFNGTSVATAKTYFPAECLSAIAIQKTVDVANYPDWVPVLRARKLRYFSGLGGEVSVWSSTVSGSVITLPNNASAIAILAALAEDVLVHGGYTNWRTLTISGVEYPITNINTVTREITVTGSPSAGTQNVEFYPHRIVGSTTTARIFETTGRSIITPNDSSGRHIAYLRVRDRFQGHRFFSGMGTTNLSSFIYGQDTSELPGLSSGLIATQTGTPDRQSITSLPKTDGTNSTPRTGSTTHSPGISAHLYEHVGRYIA
jgi:hypothetical protein